MTWNTETLKQHYDELRTAQRDSDERLLAANEQRFAAFGSQLEAIRSGWHDRFVSHEKSMDDRIAVLQKSIDELRRLVYIGLGIVIAVQVIVPLVHH